MSGVIGCVLFVKIEFGQYECFMLIVIFNNDFVYMDLIQYGICFVNFIVNSVSGLFFVVFYYCCIGFFIGIGY